MINPIKPDSNIMKLYEYIFTGLMLMLERKRLQSASIMFTGRQKESVSRNTSFRILKDF